MPVSKDVKPGTFCWVELGTSDSASAKKFYGSLFGWKPNDTPAGPDMTYTMLQLDGKDAGGMYEMPDDMKSMGIPPHWLSYVNVVDVDATTKKAGELGAKIMREPMDVMEVGRMAVIQDPTGATFALWQPKAHGGASVVNEPGALCWNELLTTDTGKASKFYSELFGWTANTKDMGGMMYTSFMNGDQPAAGMMEITKQMGPVPPNWMVYFATDDCDKTADKATTGGAKVLCPPTDIPGVGRFAAAADPQGAAFSFIKLEMQP